MGFIQLITYSTNRPDDVDKILSEWIANTAGIRTATRTRVGVDHDHPDRYVEILEFASAADAAINSALPQTYATHHAFAKLSTEGPHFTNLKVVRDEQLHFSAADRPARPPNGGNAFRSEPLSQRHQPY
jgi:hypothetical protein